MANEKWRTRFSKMRQQDLMLKSVFLCGLFILLSACEHVAPQFQMPVTQIAVEKTLKKPLVKSLVKPVIAPVKIAKVAQPIAVVKGKASPNFENNLWQYIAKRHTLRAPSHKNLFWHLDWFKKNPDYLTRVTKRAEPYLYFITKEVEKAGLPIEIALLPIVESAYYPFSFSHGTASGLWQFIPATGKLYGLKQNYWTDERRSVILSTRAAIAYLKNLHTLFKGDWLLAIAAYNSGPGRVQKAIDKNRALGKKTDFWHIDLPKETEGYVPRLLAVAELIKHPQKYNQIISLVENRPKLEIVPLYEQLDLALIESFSGLSLTKIYNLNPDLNRWATPDAPRYQLFLPIDVVAKFKKARHAYPRKKRLNYKRYQVKSGDSLIQLAKHFNSSVAYIKNINNLSGTVIKTGQKIIIPVPQKTQDYYILSQDQREMQRLNSKKNGKKIIHKVKKGESLWSIAQKYGHHVDYIIRWNHLSSAAKALQIGQKLVLWQVQKTKPEALKGLTKVGVDVKREFFYTIKQGDSLSSIAHKFGMRVKMIVSINQLDKKKVLKIGQKLKIIKPIVSQ